MLRPPIDLMEPTAVKVFPALDEALWQPKADGWRCCAIIDADGVQLQSLAKNLITRRFPEIVPVLAELPAGVVLDGEMVCWKKTAAGKSVLDFGAMNRTPRHRRETGARVQYLAFDLLADAGGEDLRKRPLSERWPRLLQILDDAADEVAPIFATRDRDEAELWERTRFLSRGYEGTVAKRWSSPYRPGPGLWWKRRAVDTVDGTILEGVAPASMRVQLDNGDERVTEPLTSDQVKEIADVLAERPGRAGPLRAEFRKGAGRHGRVVYVRLRADE
jgi:bifunctional non-homologous end joining protein LigD